MRLSVIGFIIVFCLINCTREETKKYHNQSQQSNRVEESKQLLEPTDTSIADESKNELKRAYHITFDREQNFGTTDSVVVGEMASFAVDNKNRIFIADMEQTTVHVFDPGGNYISSLGRQGKGPAEFASVSPNTVIKVHLNRLYVPDYPDPSAFFPTRVQVFTLKDISFSHTMKLIAKNRNNFNELKKYYPLRIYPRNEGKFLVEYHRQPSEYQDSTSFIRYFVQDSTGAILTGPILEQEDRTNLTYLNKEAPYPYLAISSFPFFKKSLIAVSNNDYVYAARSVDFQIEVYNPSGKRIREFSHPFENKLFNKDKVIKQYKRTNYKSGLGEGVAIKMIEEAENLPNTWPALQSMFFDDQDRLWVSTIVGNDAIYQWWLLKKNGDIITKFNWPRDKPIKEVKNGYIYTLETEQETGLQEIVRYSIEKDVN